MSVKSDFLDLLRWDKSAVSLESAREILREAGEIRADYSDFLHHYTINVDPSVLILGESEDAQDFVDYAQKNGYQAGAISPSHVISISGHLGAFEAQVKLGEEIGKLHFSQIVLFCEDSHLMRFKGCENAGEYENPEQLVEKLNSRLGQFSYHAPVHYDAHFCQYDSRRSREDGGTWCHRCVDVCPSFGVSRDDSLMQLNFSALDCIACGKCVMVCPSGAIQRDSCMLEAFQKISKLYSSVVPVVMNDGDDSYSQRMCHLVGSGLDCAALPLFVPQVHALNEVYLLTLIQESGRQVVIFDEARDELLLEKVAMVNAITQAIFNMDAIFLVDSTQKLPALLQEIKEDGILDWHYTYAQNDNEPIYQIFSERMLAMVRGGDFGEIPAKHHGRVVVDSSLCTLCLSCVGACNVGALSSNEFVLFHKPSLCTTCGYCEASCPEKAIKTDFGGIALQAGFFSKNAVAKSESFSCVECGRVFASKKSIDKISALMASVFQGDSARLRSLECCDTCKVKVMFGV